MTNYDNVWDTPDYDPAAEFEAAEAATPARGKVRIRFDLNHVGAQFHYWEQDVDATDVVAATKALAASAKSLEPFFRETFKRTAQPVAQAAPVAQGTGAAAVAAVASGTASPGGAMQSGVNPKGTEVLFVPSSVLPQDQFKAQAIQQLAGKTSTPTSWYTCFDNRTGPNGLEAGSTSNYSAGAIKLAQGAPGVDQFLTGNGKPATVAWVSFNRDGSLYVNPTKEYAAFLKVLAAMQATAPAAQPDTGVNFF